MPARRRTTMSPPADGLLGLVAQDRLNASNERVRVRVAYERRPRVLRNQYVTIDDALTPGTVFLGRLVGGPFFPRPADQGGEIFTEVEIQGELKDGQPHDTNNRPTP